MIPKRVASSMTLDLLQKVREARQGGADIASFAAGEPDFPTPELVVNAAKRSLERGNTKYVSTQGLPELREVVSADYRTRLKAEWVRPEHVLTTAGAKQGIYLVLTALLEKGDEVIVPKPYWVSYPEVVQAAGGVCRYVETRPEDRFFPTVEGLEKTRSPKSKALIFASPCNPTGTMIDPAELKKIVDWCLKNKITLIYDELYERLVLKPGMVHATPLSMVNEAQAEYVVSVNACSKTMAMTGWRLGWVVSNKTNISALSAFQGQMLTCLPGFVQDAATEGLKRVNEFLPDFVKLFQRRLKLMMDGLAKIPGVTFVEPTGAFYLFANVSEVMKKKGLKADSEFTNALFDEYKVALLPGSSMGMPGWVRFSFAASDEDIKKGLERLAQFCAV